MIRQIAEPTGLLALNANTEAARASGGPASQINCLARVPRSLAESDQGLVAATSGGGNRSDMSQLRNAIVKQFDPRTWA
ncbi:MAG: hypothetical protein AAGI72_04680 [Pseudomonadota bacterium]